MTEAEDGIITNARQYYEDLKNLYDGASVKILPRLDEKLRNNKLTIEDTPLCNVYIRLYLAVGSLLRLNHRKDFQVLASTARIILELYLDIHLLNRNLIPKGFEKFKDFGKLKKFDIAKRRRNWAEENNFPYAEKFPKRLAYLKECTSFEERIQELWGSQVLNHWTGLDIASRAKKLGNQFIEYYLLLYDLGNWYIHSGPLNYVGLDKTTADLIAGLSYGIVADMFADASQLCIKNFNLELDCN